MKTKSKLFFIVLLVVLPLLAVNCALPGAASPTPTSTSTATLVPTLTYTPTSTNTLLPTSTFTPLPTATATPDIEATRAAERDQAARNMLVELNLPADSGSLGWYQQNEEIPVKMDTAWTWEYQPFAEDFSAADFVIYTEMTWSDGYVMCGFLFRADKGLETGDSYNIYFSRYAGEKGWWMGYNRDGHHNKFITGDNVKISDFLNVSGASTNKIVLAAVDNAFSLYINGHYEGQYFDYTKNLSEGGFSFFGVQDSGYNTCSLNNTWVWIYK